jgi:Tfp pilus assembly pilus retraction ATPase PilT
MKLKKFNLNKIKSEISLSKKDLQNEKGSSKKSFIQVEPFYIRKVKQLAQELNITDIIANLDKELDSSTLMKTILNNPKFHRRYIKELFPDKKIYNSLEELENDDFDVKYFLEFKEDRVSEELAEIGAICVRRKSDDAIFIGYLFPSLNIHIDFEDFFFIDTKIYSYFYNTKNISISSENNEDNSFEDILKYMEANEVSDLHFQLADEYSYYFTARFGQELVRITDRPILKANIDKLYNQALIKIGKDNLSSPPEVSGLIKEKLIGKNGHMIERTFRFHSMYDNKGGYQGRAVSIRRLMNYDEIDKLGLEGLNYTKKAINLIQKASNSTHGVVFITGKTNSGKSTLLYAILNSIYKEGRRIKSIESPIEIVAPYSQVDLTASENADEKYRMTREIAIAALLRQDPDVVLISEVRTKSEVDDFVELGLKGHLAFTTMHTGSVEETISRALKSVEEETDLQQTINLIVSQELVKKRCPICYGKKKVDGKYCENCNGLGVKGVLPIYEVAYFHHLETGKDNIRDIKSLIQRGKVEYISKKEIMQYYYDRGLVLKSDYERVMENEADLAQTQKMTANI